MRWLAIPLLAACSGLGTPDASAFDESITHIEFEIDFEHWLDEGASDAAQFARMRAISGNSMLFDASCLADVDALTGGP